MSVQSRSETRVGSSSNRVISHDYYYVHFHPAIDAIKYRIMRLKRKVEQMYQQDVSKKDWRCPHCKAEYGELEVLDSIGAEGFICHRCGHVLVETEEAGKPSGTHEKIRKLNTQLNKFENIILQIDAQTVPENNFYEAWERRKEIPKIAGTGQTVREFVAVGNRRDERTRGPDQVDASALNINLTSNAELDKEEEAKREARRAELAKQNQLPVWHTSSAISGAGPTDVQAEERLVGGILKKEESEDKKLDSSLQNDLAIQAYLAEMKQEQEEEERKKALEEMESVDDDDDEDFEDVVSTSAMGTPASSQPRTSALDHTNGVKREFESDSAPSSDANTPANADTPPSMNDMGRESKRVKFNDNGRDAGIEASNGAINVGVDSDDEDDEADFEDAM